MIYRAWSKLENRAVLNLNYPPNSHNNFTHTYYYKTQKESGYLIKKIMFIIIVYLQLKMLLFKDRTNANMAVYNCFHTLITSQKPNM